MRKVPAIFFSAVVACAIATLIGLACRPASSEVSIALVSSRSVDDHYLTRIRLRSSLPAKNFSSIVQSRQKELQATVDLIPPPKVKDKAFVRRVQRNILEILGPEAHLIEISIEVLPVRKNKSSLEDTIRKLPGTLGYTHKDEAGDKQDSQR